MLDAMDVMLYSLGLTYLIREFSMDTRTAGFLNSLTLVGLSDWRSVVRRSRRPQLGAHVP